MTPLSGILIIHCSDYDNCSNLPCTRNDASSIRAALVDTGSYSSAFCWELASPTRDEIEAHLRRISPDLRSLDLLTVYFSGHGHLSTNENYYLCPKDFDSSVPSLSGFSVSTFVRLAADLNLSVLNVVLDACFSGSSQGDLREALERPAKSENVSVCVSLLAASLADQAAFTGSPLSQFTAKLIEFIEGGATTHSKQSWISLSDIAPKMGVLGEPSSGCQEIVHVALNVLGPTPFCRNPLHSTVEDQPHSRILSPNSKVGRQAYSIKDSLARIYVDMDKGLDDAKLLEIFKRVADSSEDHEEDLATLFDHYADWLLARAHELKDWSLPLRIAGAITTSLIGIEQGSLRLSKTARNTAGLTLHQDLEFFRERFREWMESTSGIDHKIGAIDSFHHLPVKISIFYGRLGLLLLAQHIGLLWSDDLVQIVQTTSDFLINKFPDSHVIVNERQAFYLVPFFQGCERAGLNEAAERTWGHYFLDHFLMGGRALREEANASAIWAYFKLRRDEDDTLTEGTASTNTVLPVLLYAAHLIAIEEIADHSLLGFNEDSTNIAMCSNPKSFRDACMRDALNCTVTIGSDAYTTEQFINLIIEPFGNKFPLGNDWTEELFYCALAGYISGDRVAAVGRERELPNHLAQ